MSNATSVSTEVKPLNVEHHRLNNGMQLLFKPMPGAPRLAFALYVRGGNQLDEVPGQIDLIDRLLTKGTATKDVEAIAVALDSLSLEMDNDTRRDYSVMGGTVLAEDLGASLALMAELLFESTLDELPREVEKFEGELVMALDSPKARASDQLVRALFEGTPYGAVSTVLQNNLEAAAKPQPLMDLYQRAYRPDRMVVSVAGDMPVQPLIEAFETAFKVRKPSAAACGSTALPSLLAARSLPESRLVTYAWPDAKQAHIYKAWLAPKATHPDYYPLMVMNTILGGAGLTARLFLELRDKQGLAYNVRSSLEAYQHRGMFSLYIGTDPANVAKCLKGFEDECQKLVDVLVGDQELAETKRNVLGRRTVFTETASQWASFIGSNVMAGRTLADIEASEAAIAAVTAHDIQRVAKALFSSPCVVSIAGPADCLPTSL
jgi:zinc protease